MPRSTHTTRAFSLAPLFVLISSSLGYTTAASAETTSPTQTAATEDNITVIAKPHDGFRSGGDTLVPAYLDGQVANGGRLGILGQQDARNVPFNVIGYTSKMIADKQASTLSDIIRNDVTIQPVRGYGNFGESYRVRGFLLDGDDISYGGLYGVLPRQVTSTAFAERIEVIKGSTAFLNGVPPGGSGVGGAINVEPKRADSEPNLQLGLDYTGASQVGGHVDAGRRFGEDDRWGVRVNALHREGESEVHDQKNRTSLASIGLDYKGDKLRGSLDAGYQKQTVHHGRIGVGLGTATEVPAVPDNRTNYSQPWVYTDMRTRFAALRSEYDMTSDWTLYGGFGTSENDEEGSYSTPKLINNQGDTSQTRLTTRYIADSYSGMTGVRGKFDTGAISHNINLGYSGVYRKTRAAYTMSASKTAAGNNIYHPWPVPYPETALSASNLADPTIRSRTTNNGISLSDTLSALDDKVHLTVGARRQDIRIRNYSYAGVEDPKTRFDAFKLSPVYGIVFKPWEPVSFYANHIEALQPGPTAPTRALNAGNVIGVVQSKQNEVGVKMDFERIGGSLALFEIKKPVGLIDADGIYGLYGEQRSRGAELNVFGEPVFGVRVLGSALWIDPMLTKAAEPSNNGNDAVGVPRYSWSVGGEWDLPWVRNLTATGTLTRTGSQYANAANSIKLNGWTRLDMGVRYAIPVNAQTVTLRANIENVTDEKYWASVDDSGTYITQSEPRTLKLSATVDF